MPLRLDDYRSEAALRLWIQKLGVTDAPVPRAGVRTALRFFFQYMPKLAPENPSDPKHATALDLLRAMDLSRAVKCAPDLPTGTQLIAFRTDPKGSPFGLFYARPGGTSLNLGVNDAGRSAVRYRVRIDAPALESYTSGVIDAWSIPAEGQHLTVAPHSRTSRRGVMAAGGGVQLIVPNSADKLEVVQ